MSNRRHSLPPNANGGIHLLPPQAMQQVIQQVTPFNDVQTIAMMAANIVATAPEVNSETMKNAVCAAQDMLLNAIELNGRFMAGVQLIQQKMKAESEKKPDLVS